MGSELTSFVRDALGRGVPREEIRAKLREARWPEDEVDRALAAWADVDFAIPVPRPSAYISAREAFGYLVLFTALYTSAVNLIRLIYELIHHVFPEPGLNFYALERALSTLRWSTAAVLVTFPVYLWLARRSYLAAREDPDRRTSRIRKWLTYLTLFAAAATLLCDAIALVYHLLAGEITERFLLKVLTVAAVAGSVFGYYLWDIRQDDLPPEEAGRRHPGLRVFAGATSAVVAVCVAFGLVLAGAPEAARSERHDELRVQHLQRIARSIDTYWSYNDRLPASLEALNRERSGAPGVITDPVTGVAYEYYPGEGSTYQLCATFDTEQVDSAPTPGRGSRFWEHPPGHHCYDIGVIE